MSQDNILSHKHEDQFSRKRISVRTLIELSTAHFSTVWRRALRAASSEKSQNFLNRMVIRLLRIIWSLIQQWFSTISKWMMNRQLLMVFREQRRPANPSCDTDPGIRAEMNSSCWTAFSEFQKSNKMYGYEEWVAYLFVENISLERH